LNTISPFGQGIVIADERLTEAVALLVLAQQKLSMKNKKKQKKKFNKKEKKKREEGKN
jgi:hypothetical protein